jgi:hypothetical protein
MKLNTMHALAAAILLPLAPAQAEVKPDAASIWTFQTENDTISTQRITDRYYTAGLRLAWTSPTDFAPDLVSRLGRTLWGEGRQRIGIELSQQIYTPSQTQLLVPDPRDRPYAGYLSANFSLLNDTDSHRSLLVLGLGVIGPAAGGEDAQNGFHRLIGEHNNRGWNSQIPNTPAIELLHERIWRLPIGNIAGLETDALPSLTVGLGSVRDYAQVGISFRIGQGLDSDFGAPRQRPGLSGGDVFVPARPFAWYLFAGVDGQAIAYDALLQSHPFRSGPHVRATWNVAELQAGVAVMFAGLRLTFTYVAQTPEFKDQAAGLHQFGSAALSVRF